MLISFFSVLLPILIKDTWLIVKQGSFLMVQRLCLSLNLFIFCLCSALFSQAEITEPVQVALIHEHQAIQPGRSFWVAFRLQLQDNWHTYWKNPGDAGMATAIEWELPEGFSASQVLWPTPTKFALDSMVGFGYESEVLLLTQITPPKVLPNDKPAELKAKINWLVCSDSQCLPGNSEATLVLEVSTKKSTAKTEWAELFDKARSQLPRKHSDLHVYRNINGIELELVLSDQKNHPVQAYFYPDENYIIDHTTEVILVPIGESNDKYRILLKETDHSQKLHTDNLKGVLVLSNNERMHHSIEIDSPIIETGGPISMVDIPSGIKKENFVSESNAFEGGLAMALLLAFVGGMILNLMPCVLPVVSFKILSFVKLAGQSRKETLKHGLAFFIGVLISFWILAGGLLLLQAYGHTVGWGFQLQEPLFVAGLASLLLIFGISLFGVFELGAGFTNWAGSAQQQISNKAPGLGSSFFSGILATVVATPCTGPLLGAALGFAATLSPFFSMLIFTAIGLGMALPYLVLACFPSLLKFLPKPGAWMETFKELMGFLMIATVIWLVWVFGAQTDNTAVVKLLAGFLVLSIGSWCYGRWGSPVIQYPKRLIGIALAIICLTAGGYVIYNASQS